MNKLSQTNTQKLTRMLIRSSLIIFLILTIIFLISYFNNALPKPALIISIVILGCIIFPIGIILTGVLFWNIRQRKKLQIYDRLKLDKIGFTDKEINTESFWKLEESIKIKKTENYIITINLSETNSNQLKIEIPLKWRKVEKNEFKILEGEFKSLNIEIGIGCIVKKESIKSLLTNYDANNFSNKLKELISFIKTKGFKPKD